MVHQDRAAVTGIFTYYMAEYDQIQFPSIMPCSLELLVTFIHFHPLRLWHSVLFDRFFLLVFFATNTSIDAVSLYSNCVSPRDHCNIFIFSKSLIIHQV